MADQDTSGPPPPSRWEWVIAAVSSIVVLASIAFLLYEGITGPATGPEIQVVADSVRRGPGGYVVFIRAHNGGGTTAASLMIEGELRDAGGTVEVAETVIDFVPAGGRRSAGLIFERDPAAYRLEIRARGFDLP